MDQEKEERNFGDLFRDCFQELYGTADVLAFVIRGHLYCESALTQLLEANFKNPNAIDVDRLQYRTKVELCVALGLIDPSLTPGLHKLGLLRNKFGHNLTYVATEVDQRDFVNTVKSSLGAPAKFYLSRGRKFPNGLRRCILALWIPLQIHLAFLTGHSEELLPAILDTIISMWGTTPGGAKERLKQALDEVLNLGTMSNEEAQSLRSDWEKSWAEINPV